MTGELPRLGQAPLKVEPEPEDERLWSVTTITKALDRPALKTWAVKVTAEGAVDDIDNVQARLRNEGRDSAIAYVKGAQWRTGPQVSAAALGTIAHHLFQRYALTGQRPPVTPDLHPDSHKGKRLSRQDVATLAMMLDQFDRFLQEMTPEYIAAEVVVFSPYYGFAGTADAYMRIDGVPLLADYKTSREAFDWEGKYRKPYPEIGLQLAAYRHAELAAVWRARKWETGRGDDARRYYLLNTAERELAVPVPHVDGGIGIQISPQHYGVHPVKCDASVFDAFLHVMDVARYSFQTAKRVVGNAMPPLHPLEAEGDPFAGIPQDA